MNKPSIFRVAYTSVRRPTVLLVLLVLGILASACYPSKLRSYPVLPPGAATPTEVRLTEDSVRYVPTVLQIAIPILLADEVGMAQLLYVGISTTVATQGAKFLLNDVTVAGVRLGERPRGNSYNMPSGHSSMSSCAVYFLGRRYSVWLGLLLSIIMGMTMYSRVMLNAHTISAVITGALIGFLCAALFTSARSGPYTADARHA
jgi:lipid A 1-phosphatase